MKIGSVDLNLPAGKVWSTLTWGFWSIIGFVITCVIAYFVWKWWKERVLYKDKVTLTIVFENGTEKTVHGLKGGKYVGKQGAWDYRIKVPKVKKPKELGYLPDFSLADSDGTIHFTTCGDQTYWQQASWRTQIKDKRVIKDEEGNEVEQVEFELLKKPIIGSDEKNIMIKDIKNWRDVVAKNKVTAFAIGLGMFLIMVIAHLISLFIQTKIRCPLPTG